MIGIFLITHGNFGECLIHNAEHILGYHPPFLTQLGLCAQGTPESLFSLAKTRLQEADAGQGVLILTDMLGASPANLAQKLLVPGRIEALAGLNLPMLLRALTYRQNDLPCLLQKARSGGCDGVVSLSP